MCGYRGSSGYRELHQAVEGPVFQTAFEYHAQAVATIKNSGNLGLGTEVLLPRWSSNGKVQRYIIAGLYAGTRRI